MVAEWRSMDFAFALLAAVAALAGAIWWWAALREPRETA
jgi:hypothetical protein